MAKKLIEMDSNAQDLTRGLSLLKDSIERDDGLVQSYAEKLADAWPIQETQSRLSGGDDTEAAKWTEVELLVLAGRLFVAGMLAERSKGTGRFTGGKKTRR